VSTSQRFFSTPAVGPLGKAAALRQRRDLVVAGAFVVVMLTLLIAGLWLVSSEGLRGHRYTARFDTIKGIRPGSRVEQSGYVIGAVREVRPLFAANELLPRFEVELRIDSDWPIARDSKAVITSSSPLSGNIILIEPGESSEALPPGSEIASGGVAPDIAARLGELAGNLERLVDETVKPILTTVQEQAKKIEDMLTGGETGDGGKAAKTLDDVTAILGNIREVSDKLNRQMEAVDPEQIRSVVGSARSVSDDAANLVADLQKSNQDLRNTLKEFQGLGASVNRLVTANETKVEQVTTDSQYMVQELATALSPILNNLDGATRNLLELSQDLRANPALLLGGREVKADTPEAR
jgi:phospholipid/cholesterol/gamma-HCH transport system substrate-binding protein